MRRRGLPRADPEDCVHKIFEQPVFALNGDPLSGISVQWLALKHAVERTDICVWQCLHRSRPDFLCSHAGAPLDFGKGRWLDLDRGIVSATPSVHQALLQAIKDVEDQPQ